MELAAANSSAHATAEATAPPSVQRAIAAAAMPMEVSQSSPQHAERTLGPVRRCLLCENCIVRGVALVFIVLESCPFALTTQSESEKEGEEPSCEKLITRQTPLPPLALMRRKLVRLFSTLLCLRSRRRNVLRPTMKFHIIIVFLL